MMIHNCFSVHFRRVANVAIWEREAKWKFEWTPEFEWTAEFEWNKVFYLVLGETEEEKRTGV